MDFGVLGPLEARRDGVNVELGPRKQRMLLLALLTAPGVPRSGDQLIDDVWGDDPPGDPRASLRAYLSNLRKVIEPNRAARSKPTMLLRRGNGYVLSVDERSVDSLRFESALVAARAEPDAARATTLLDGALSLWRGDAFADAAYEDFAGPASTRLVGLRAEAVARLARCHLATGRPDQAVTLLESSVVRDPYDEGVRRQLAVSLYAAGRQTDALASIAATRALLLDELGLDPSPELREVEQRILRHDPDLVADERADLVAESPVSLSATSSRSSPVQRVALPGRSVEVQTLVAEHEQVVASARRGVAVLSAPPGAGKTRVVEEFSARFASRDGTVVWSRAEAGASSLALWPWSTALRDLIDGRAPDEVDLLLGADRQPLEWFVPGLGAAPSSTEPIDDAARRFQAFDATVRVLRRLAADGSVLWIAEDIHFADAASVELLLFAARRLADTPILFVVTVRDSALDDPNIAELLQLPGLVDLRLGPLDRAGLVDLVAAERPDLDPDQLAPVAEALERRTGGNPFFALQLVRTLASSDPVRSLDAAGAPDGVAAAVVARVASLPTGATELLTVASAARAEWTLEVSAAVAEIDLDTAIDAVEAAAEAGLVEEVPDLVGAYRFSHALVGEVLYGRLSPLRRARLHARLGPMVEARRSLDEPENVAALARHYCLGAPAGTALAGAAWAREAARRSIRLHDPASAARMVAMGLDALEHAPATDERTALRIELLRERSEAERRLSDAPAAQSSAIEAFSLAEERGWLVAMADAALTYSGAGDPGPWLGYWFDDDVAERFVDQVLSHPDVRELDDRRRVRLLNRLADAVHEARPTGRAAEATETSIALARTIDDPQLIVESLIMRCLAAHWALDRAEHEALAAEIVSVAKGAGLDRSEIYGRRIALGLAIERGDAPAMQAQLTEIEALGERSADDGVAFIAAWLPVPVALFRGELDSVESSLAAIGARFEHFEDALHETLLIILMALLREQHRMIDVSSVLVERHDVQPSVAWRAPLLLTYAEHGRLDEAHELLTRMPREDFDRIAEGPLQFLTTSLLAESLAHLGAVDQAEVLLSFLEPHTDRLVNTSAGMHYWGWLGYHVGRLCTTVGRFDDARDHLEEAHRRSASIGAVPAAMRCRVALAELDAAAAADAAPAARGAAAELAVEADAAGLANIAVWARRIAGGP